MEEKELIKKLSSLFEESKKRKIVDFDGGLLNDVYEHITGSAEGITSTDLDVSGFSDNTNPSISLGNLITTAPFARLDSSMISRISCARALCPRLASWAATCRAIE